MWAELGVGCRGRGWLYPKSTEKPFRYLQWGREEVIRSDLDSKKIVPSSLQRIGGERAPLQEGGRAGIRDRGEDDLSWGGSPGGADQLTDSRAV